MSRLLTELTTDLSLGMFDSVAPTAFPKASVRTIYNGRIQPDGSVQRRPGSKRTSSSTPNNGIGYGGAFFTTAGGEDQIIDISGSVASMSTDFGETWTEIATGLREDWYSIISMREGATQYLLMANGDTTIKRWDGGTWDTVTNAPEGVKYIAEFGRRLYATGHSGVLVQASAVGDMETWATADGGLTVQVDAPPTGLFQIGPHLLVFDRTSTSYIEGYGEQTIIVAAGATGFSRSVGCVAFRTVVGVGDNGACWLSERGVEYYVPGSNIELISRSVQGFMDDIDKELIYANPGYPSATYDEIEQNYHLAISNGGAYNNRVLVLNLLQKDVEYQRGGTKGAATIDIPGRNPVTALLFSETGDADGYLTVDAGGHTLEEDADGYATIDTDDSDDTIVYEDADGYLSDSNDTLPATLFMAPSANKSRIVYSVGYDGYLRRHSGVDKDDMLYDSTGGSDVTLTILSKPFQLRRPRQKKRVRRIDVASIQEANATLAVSVTGAGSTTTAQSVTQTTLGSDTAYRSRIMTKLDADNPQIQVTTTDDVKITLLGLSALLLREAT